MKNQFRVIRSAPRSILRDASLKPILAGLGLFMSAALFAGGALAQATPLRARTDQGREVLLRNDGTWIFVDPVAPQAAQPKAAQPQVIQPQPASPMVKAITPSAPQPPLAPQPPSATQLPNGAARAGVPTVQRPRDATAQFTTRRGNFRFWYNPAKWRPSPENADGRVQLQLIGSEAYIVVIPEGTPIPIAQLKTLAFENVRQSGSDARIVSEQMRAIAGREILAMQINVTVNNTPVVFIGYYYGDPRGSIQVVGYTTERDLPRLQAQILEGLDGLDLNR